MPSEIVVDFVVVGGGLTGCAIASRLSQSEKKPRVILIEAGPDPTDNEAARTFLTGLSLLGGEYDYLYKTEPDPNTGNRVHNLNAGKVLGGGSILNLGGWMRADAADYDDWADLVGDERWSNKGLSPWFRKLEHFHDTPDSALSGDESASGPMHVFPVSVTESGTRKYLLREPVKEAWTELGVASNPRKANGSIAGLTEFYENADPQGMRQPSYKVYPLNDVQVLTNTPVSRVILDTTTKVATGVELNDGRTVTARNEVILCAGAHRTPQLLMLSGIGPSEVLARHNIPLLLHSPHVGQNLYDHFAVFLAFRLRDPSKGYALGGPHPAWTENPALFKYLPWDWVVSEPLPESESSNDAPLSSLVKARRNLYEIITMYTPPGIPGIPIDGSHIATSTMLLRPTSRGTVLIRSADPSDRPVIAPNYLATQLDRDALVYATKRTLRALLGTKSLQSIVECESPPRPPATAAGSILEPLTVGATDDAIEQRIRQTGSQHAHSGGTAAMGKVVDAEGKVVGVEHLRVADASIVPIPLGGHPQATLYAVAEQIAGMVIERWS